MKIFSERALWRLYSFSAFLTLTCYLVVGILYTIATPKEMLSFAIKNFWLHNLFLYLGLLLIGILALKRYKFSLIIGAALLYTIGHIFYIAFIWSTATTTGFGGFLIYASAVLGVVVELLCIWLIIKIWFVRK